MWGLGKRPVLCQRDRSVMVAHYIWDVEEQFESDDFDLR